MTHDLVYKGTDLLYFMLGIFFLECFSVCCVSALMSLQRLMKLTTGGDEMDRIDGI